MTNHRRNRAWPYLAAALVTALFATGCGKDWQLGSWHIDQENPPRTGKVIADDRLLTTPWGIALHAGEVYVTEKGGHRLLKLAEEEVDEDTEFIWETGGFGSEDGQLSSPEGLAIDQFGNLFVADRGNGRIQKFSPEGEYLDQFGDTDPEGEPGDLIAPVDIAIDPITGQLFITDAGTDQIVRLSSEGIYLDHWGTTGDGQGELDSPAGIALDADTGELFVVDAGNGRVQVFSKEGEYLDEFGEPSPTDDLEADEGDVTTLEDWQLTGPWGIAVEPGTGIWVADRIENRIQLFSFSGLFIRTLKVVEEDPALNTPTGITYVGGTLWMTESTPNRVRGF